MFIKTTEGKLVNLNAIECIFVHTINEYNSIIKANVNHATYTLGVYRNTIQAINAMHDLEDSIATQSPLHEMKDPEPHDDDYFWRFAEQRQGNGDD